MILNNGKETDVLSTVNIETVNLEVGTDCTVQQYTMQSSTDLSMEQQYM